MMLLVRGPSSACCSSSREVSHYFASSSSHAGSQARTACRHGALCDRRAMEKGSVPTWPSIRIARPRRTPQRSVASLALFDPPPFRPEKLTIVYTPGISLTKLSAGRRRYTLTHNDITGDLSLTVGSDYNYSQISGFYTRLLRDEVIAEWKAPEMLDSIDDMKLTDSHQLHIYCHVSGEEKWLAPPLLRNYIFRREIPLVLETFLHADRQLFVEHPSLQKTQVLVHFQSDVEGLDRIEFWGLLGDRSTWQAIPTSIMQRFLYALVGRQMEDPASKGVLDPLLPVKPANPAWASSSNSIPVADNGVPFTANGQVAAPHVAPRTQLHEAESSNGHGVSSTGNGSSYQGAGGLGDHSQGPSGMPPEPGEAGTLKNAPLLARRQK